MLSSKPKASCMQLMGFLMVTNMTLFPFMKELTDTGAEKYLEVQLSSMRWILNGVSVRIGNHLWNNPADAVV